MSMSRKGRALRATWGALALLALLAMGACGHTTDREPAARAMPETVLAVVGRDELIRVPAGEPSRVLHRVALGGLADGEHLVGMDFRVSRGVLYGLTNQGRLLTIDPATGRTQRVGQTTIALEGSRFGFDVNPAADRIRVVSDTGQNLRLHPDTGALAATDPRLNGEAAGQVLAAAYTYHKTNDKLTTNYAIDAQAGALVRQGSLEGVEPVVSPNTGRIFPVGPLGTGPVDDASFDISDVRNTALAALTQGGRTRLYQVELATGRATLLGSLGGGQRVWGIAIEP